MGINTVHDPWSLCFSQEIKDVLQFSFCFPNFKQQIFHLLASWTRMSSPNPTPSKSS